MLDASWLLCVVWDLCSMCKSWRLGAFLMYHWYLVILYLLVFLELLTSSLASFVIPFSVWRVHHHFCSDHQDELQYNTMQYYAILYYTTLLENWSSRVGLAGIVEPLAMVLFILILRHQLVIQQTRSHNCAITRSRISSYHEQGRNKKTQCSTTLSNYLNCSHLQKVMHQTELVQSTSIKTIQKPTPELPNKHAVTCIS